MHTKIKVPYGYTSMSLDDMLIIYSGKIRVKYSVEHVPQNIKTMCSITQGRKDCVTLQYITTDYQQHVRNIKEIDMFLYSVMTNRLIDKYINKHYNVDIEEDNLPF